MQPVLLAFNLNEEKLNKMRLLAMMLKVRFRPVPAEEAALSIGALAGIRDLPQPQGAADPITDEMLVLCHFSQAQLDRFLAGLRERRISVPLKAILTDTNALWTAAALCAELKEEREAVRQSLSKHGS